MIEVSIKGSPPKLLVFSMSTHQGSLELRPDCYGDFVDDDKETSKLTLGSDFGFRKERHQFVCVWIGTVWRENDFLPQLMVLRGSIGISGVSPTPGAYERAGLILPEKYGGSEDTVNVIKS